MRTFFALTLLLTVAHCHMWLISPVSRGGEANIGGTGGPCAGKAAGSGSRTELVQGSTATLVFRVNKHGEGPFRLSFSPAGDDTGYDTPANYLADGFKYTITADGGNNYNEMKLSFKVPNTPCAKCSIQLKGMGTVGANGAVTGAWYNCADVSIGPPPVCPAICETGTPKHGVCNGAKCVCNPGWSGLDCNTSIAPDGVNMIVTVKVAPKDFNKATFITKTAAALKVPEATIEVLAVGSVKGALDQTEVAFKIKDTPTATASQTAAQFTTAAQNNQIDTGYPLISSNSAPVSSLADSNTDGGKASSPSTKKSNTGLIVGVVIGVGVVALVAVVAFVVFKGGNSRPSPSSSRPVVPPRE